jgi:16S rRNA (guanine527-N7)-methyltransferase
MTPPPCPDDVAEELGVSRETRARLALHLELLARWQRSINLVGGRSLEDPWRRHVLDSAQLRPLVPPHAADLVDLGSGAGFPGMVLAICGVRGVRLVESDGRKAQFLREVARTTGTAVEIHHGRIESLSAWPADVITARALAPLVRLLPLAERFSGPATIGLYLKGRNIAQELTEARRDWHMESQMLLRSRSDPSGRVLVLRGVCRARDRQP